jgi:hypothetical protein
MTKEGPLTRSQYLGWLDDLEKIVTDCHISNHNLKRILDLGVLEEWEFYKLPFTKHLIGQYRFTLITQLDKLYSRSPNQKRSFAHLLLRMETNGFDQSMTKFWGNGTSLWESHNDVKAEVVKLRNELEKVCDSAKRVTVYRSAVTAHTQAEPTQVGEPDEDDFELLNLVARKVLNKLQNGGNMPTTRFSSVNQWSIDSILKAYTDKLSRDSK